MSLLLKWLIMAMSIFLAARIMPGVEVRGLMAAAWVALFLGIVNVLLRPLLILLTLPINILTLGLFTFVINGFLVLLASSLVKGFLVRGLWSAIAFSVLLSLINYVLGRILGTK